MMRLQHSIGILGFSRSSGAPSIFSCRSGQRLSYSKAKEEAERWSTCAGSKPRVRRPPKSTLGGGPAAILAGRGVAVYDLNSMPRAEKISLGHALNRLEYPHIALKVIA